MKPANKFLIYAVIAIVAIIGGGLTYYAYGEINKSNFSDNKEIKSTTFKPKTFENNKSETDLKFHKKFHLFNDKNCGKLKQTRPKIVNGKTAKFLTNPWIVALNYLQRDGSVEVKCAGTLISEKIVLTASHCLKTGKESLVSIRLGDYDLSTEIDCHTDDAGIKVCADPIQEISREDFTIVTHQNFSKFLKVYCDIGLIKLKVSANLHQNNIGTICLPFEDDSKIPRALEVIGWGRTESASKSDVLLTVSVPFVENEKCFKRLQEENDKLNFGTLPLIDEQFCAGDVNGSDSCAGDSGGPIQALSPRYELTQYGIVSYGMEDCGSAPGVNTKISSYLKWILDNATD